ncbi:MAG: D-aminoacylase [Hyphomonadaceae bacterium JAD_PAG50586_4]|nr:MAG: D-aminoacylase [Hyphomonadaceae bacterium JAD_PAG50586_4]
MRTVFAALAALVLAGCATASGPRYDVIIVGGTIYDGSGAAPFVGDVAIEDDRIAAVGDLSGASAEMRVDASGMAVAPGFINMLSWATETLLQDGRSQSDIRQGVTLEVMGEGWSMGPINDAMRRDMIDQQAFFHFDPTWTTLGEYLDTLERRGISTNVASFVGATTVRIHELGEADRPPTPEELARMQELVRQAMREGALGVGSSLIYAPAFYAETDELIALVAAAREFNGGYISHMRSEGDQYLQAIDELVTIARTTGARAQIYHLKPAGERNWDLSEAGLARLDAARAEGLDITANVYPYVAGATGLDAAMPPWVQEGGHDAWVARLRDPQIRARVLAEMRAPTTDWESLYQLAGSAENVILIGFKNPALRIHTGQTLAQVAAARGASPEDTIIDLVIEDDHRVDTAYVLMSEENIERNLRWHHTMIGSDEGSYTPEEPFTQFNPHPRAYGSFARFLGYYVRERRVMPLEQAIQRLTSMPAQSIAISERGSLREGYYADVVVFDPATIADHATFAAPHAYATGVRDVFVNGEQVLRDGEHTGAMPGRVVRGPGWTERN